VCFLKQISSVAFPDFPDANDFICRIVGTDRQRNWNKLQHYKLQIREPKLQNIFISAHKSVASKCVLKAKHLRVETSSVRVRERM